MTQRIIPPPDHNHTDQTFARLSHCCQSDFADDSPSLTLWYGLLLAALLALCLLTLSALSRADTPLAAARKAIPQGVCPPGHTAMWVEQSTVQCFKELQP